MPVDHLIPTIPLRLNYILWLEDLLPKGKENIHGIDIGCGASCVYPLLGAKKNGWKFLTSETDSVSLDYATNNVKDNNLQHLISVIPVEKDTSLLDLVKSQRAEEINFDFVMCNPPFFASYLELQGLSQTRSEDRAEPRGVNTGREGEVVTEGGEVAYVTRIINDSLQLKQRVRIFSVMLGRKSSVRPLKHLLNQEKASHSIYELCQGRTIRWGLAWTFHDDVTFPRSPFQEKQGERKAALELYSAPNNAIKDFCEKCRQLFQDLEMTVEDDSEGMIEGMRLQITSYKASWQNQRRKRREMLRKKLEENEIKPTSETQINSDNVEGDSNEQRLEQAGSDSCKATVGLNTERKRRMSSSEASIDSKHPKIDPSPKEKSPATDESRKRRLSNGDDDVKAKKSRLDQTPERSQSSGDGCKQSAPTRDEEEDRNPLLEFEACVQSSREAGVEKEGRVVLQLKLISGSGGRQALQGVLQYCANKLGVSLGKPKSLKQLHSGQRNKIETKLEV